MRNGKCCCQRSSRHMTWPTPNFGFAALAVKGTEKLHCFTNSQRCQRRKIFRNNQIFNRFNKDYQLLSHMIFLKLTFCLRFMHPCLSVQYFIQIHVFSSLDINFPQKCQCYCKFLYFSSIQFQTPHIFSFKRK